MKTNKLLKWGMPTGMISALSFLAMNILGQALRPDYDPITKYVSELTADGAPYVTLMRFFAYSSYVLLIIFAVCLTLVSFKKYHGALRLGFSLLALMGLISTLGFGIFPMTMDMTIIPQNIAHLIITIVVITMTIAALIIIPWGYLKQEKLKSPGMISLIAAIAFILLNFTHLIGIMVRSNALGLWQRLGIYTFYAFIFILSWKYTFDWRRLTDK